VPRRTVRQPRRRGRDVIDVAENTGYFVKDDAELNPGALSKTLREWGYYADCDVLTTIYKLK
jgi:hypothetical protein